MRFRTFILLALVAFPLFAARNAGDMTLFTLDPKTEIPQEQRDRTDDHYFHGMAIRNVERSQDEHLKRMLCELAERAQKSGTPSPLRDGEFGVRISDGRSSPQDFIVCFSQCRSPVLIVVGKTVAADREVRLTADQERSLHDAMNRIIRPNGPVGGHH